MTQRRRGLPVDDETWRVGLSDPADGLSLLVAGEGASATWPLPVPGQVTLGRSELCDVHIAHPSISRRHATLVLTSGRCTIQDLGSANGVLVRGRKLASGEEAVIAPGEAIDLGSVTVVVQKRAPGGLDPRGPDVFRPTLPPPSLAQRPPLDATTSGLIVRDPAMQRLFELIRRVGASTISVLLTGETGSGKERVAEAVHRLSSRAQGPYVRINCAALAPALLESELFGYEKGAFTGAQSAKPGLLETAAGGTILLDEIGELPLELQAKLLRALEERAVLPVGGLRPRPVDVRFVAATNRDLRTAIARGTFREDLYFRLNGITLEIPPLRERPSEIDDLVSLFAARTATSLGHTGAVTLTEPASRALRAYRWPGNVRELRNVVERAVLLAGDTPIALEHLPRDVVQPAAEAARPTARPSSPDAFATASESLGGSERGVALRADVEAYERQRISEALAECAGNQTRAAELLGLPRRTLVAKLKTLGIPRPRRPVSDPDE